MKALVLFSGGLDSALALQLIANQGIDVEALHFIIPVSQYYEGECIPAVKKIVAQLGVPLRVVRLGQEFLEMVRNPKYGYGKNLNPCIDCRILKLGIAKRIMEEERVSFLVTGEVLGQRPMSQHRQAIELIEKKTGLQGLIVRPLCARLFEPTIPEQKGWVDRERFLDIHGRSRREQIELAERFGIKDYVSPSGGCLLTDAGFSRRLKDILDYGSFDVDNVELLKVGRHFRLSVSFKLVVGRNKIENDRILSLAKKSDVIFEPVDMPGPVALGRGSFSDKERFLACRIVSRYTATDKNPDISVLIKVREDRENFINAFPIDEEELIRLRI